MNVFRTLRLVALVASGISASMALAGDGDWPMYNRDVRGSRHNGDEKIITPANANSLVELWRFPTDADRPIGVVHATPSVVDGFVYFGTATDPAFYKLAPDGKLCWTYRNPRRPAPKPLTEEQRTDQTYLNRRFQSSEQGVMTSALVTDTTVYFGDIGGWFYALDRETGEERWTIDARSKEFPGTHTLNAFFASPVMAGEYVILAGGALEQVVSAFPGYRGCTGRGLVMAVKPDTGEIAWKYDVGPKPEKLDPPMTIVDSWGKHTWHFGPATSIVWSTPSYDETSGTLYFGTDVNTAPRRPTPDNPRTDTRESCAIIALDAKTGAERWVTQINSGDVWTNAMRGYDPESKKYKDQSIGDTPKLFSVEIDGKSTTVVGAGCKNGAFYVLDATSGRIVAQTPVYQGPPTAPLETPPDPRTLALPSLIGGLQSGCATDGQSIYTNGIDTIRLGSTEKSRDAATPPTGGRVVCLSTDLASERWRHERPKVAHVGGPAPKREFHDVGDPVASGIALANGVAFFTTVVSGKLVAVDAISGSLLKEWDLGPVWGGPSVSRGRVYVGSGNTLFNAADWEAFFPKRFTGTVRCFGLAEASR